MTDALIGVNLTATHTHKKEKDVKLQEENCLNSRIHF
jgi:hypothetical protein